MLPTVVVPWIQAGYLGVSDYELFALIVRPDGRRVRCEFVPRAAAGRFWIGVSPQDRPARVDSRGRGRAIGLQGRFMIEPDYGGELAVSPRLGVAALASDGRLILQRWTPAGAGRLIGVLRLPRGQEHEPTGAAWDGRDRLVIGARGGRGWVYRLQGGRMRLTARPRFEGAVVGWVGDRVLVHRKEPYSDFGPERPRLVGLDGRTVSVGPRAVSVGTDGRVIAFVTSSGKGERLTWRDARWRRLGTSVRFPTRRTRAYKEDTINLGILALR